MAPPCRTCGHEDREEIDAALAAGQSSIRELAERYGIDRDALSRHKSAHLSAALKRVVARRETAGARKALDRLEDLYDRAESLLATAEEKGSTRDGVAAIGQLRGIVETLAKITGELDERPQVQVLNVAANPGWVELRGRVLSALGPFPEAAQAVAAALSGVGEGDRRELPR